MLTKNLAPRIEKYNLYIRYTHHLHEAGFQEKSYHINKELAELACKIGDLDLAERCYLRAIDDADKMNNVKDKITCMIQLVNEVYFPWSGYNDIRKMYDEIRLILNNLYENQSDEYTKLAITFILSKSFTLDLLELLKKEDIKEFNHKRRMFYSHVLDISNSDLKKTILKDVDFNLVYLEGANLVNACLECSNLTNTNLTNTNLTKADLTNTNLKNVGYSYTNLKDNFAEAFRLDVLAKNVRNDIIYISLKDILLWKSRKL